MRARRRSCRSTTGWSAILPKDAPGIAAGLTAWGGMQQQFEAHFSMLGNGISFVSYDVTALPNPFVAFVRERLAMPVISGRCATRRRSS